MSLNWLGASTNSFRILLCKLVNIDKVAYTESKAHCDLEHIATMIKFILRGILELGTGSSRKNFESGLTMMPQLCYGVLPLC